MSKRMRNPKKKRGSKTKKAHNKAHKVKTNTKGVIKLRDASHKFTAICFGNCSRTPQEMINVKFSRNNNGSVRVSGACIKCGTKMNTFASGKLFM